MVQKESIGFLTDLDRRYYQFLQDFFAGQKVEVFYREGEEIRHPQMTVDKAIERFSGYSTVYMSINPVITRRVKDEMPIIKWLYSDIDCGKLGLDPYNVYQEILDEYVFEGRLPMPTVAYHSGNGLWLMWAIKDIDRNVYRSEWEDCQRYIYRLLHEYGTDPAVVTDNARLYRILHSVNVKTNEYTHVLGFHEEIYDFLSIYNIHYEELPDPVKEEKKEKEVKKEKGTKKPKAEKAERKKIRLDKPTRTPLKLIPICGDSYVNKNRLLDLDTLARVRGEGYREVILFLMRVHLAKAGYDRQYQDEYLMERNELFPEPLSDSEVLRATVSGDIHSDRYNYTNERIIEWLDITEEEQKSLKTIMSEGEAKRRKQIRNQKDYQKRLQKEGKPQKADNIKQTVLTIAEELQAGRSNQEIMDELHLTKATYYRYKKQVPEYESQLNDQRSLKNSAFILKNNKKKQTPKDPQEIKKLADAICFVGQRIPYKSSYNERWEDFYNKGCSEEEFNALMTHIKEQRAKGPAKLTLTSRKKKSSA